MRVFRIGEPGTTGAGLSGWNGSLFVPELYAAGQHYRFGSRAGRLGGLAFADLPQQDAHGVGADLFDGEVGDAHPGRGQTEKRVFVHAGKPRTPVADADAPVVEIAAGLGGEDSVVKKKASVSGTVPRMRSSVSQTCCR